MKKVLCILGILLFLQDMVSYSQTLQVSLSPDKSKVDRGAKGGIATIFFDSSIEDLSIICTDENPDETIEMINDNLRYIRIDVKKDIEADGVCYRNYLLKSGSTAEYYLTTEELVPNQVLYYTVVLPDQFPSLLSVEYLFSKSAKHNIRLSYGRRFGGFVSYKWGDYKKKGTNIDVYSQDCDLSFANNVGGIRNALIGGLRLGLFQKEISDKRYALYLMVGIGYGEYGRQWENPMLVGNSTYFYSDYIKGIDSEISLEFVFFNWLSLSAGADIIMGNGRVSVDYLIGLGISFNTDNFSNR